MELAEGVPSYEILSEAEKQDCDLIVLGSTGVTDLKHQLQRVVPSRLERSLLRTYRSGAGLSVFPMPADDLVPELPLTMVVWTRTSSPALDLSLSFCAATL